MTRLDDLKRQFLVDEPPTRSRPRRTFVPTSPRAKAPVNGKRLLRWMIEEADEQISLGVRPAIVRVGKADRKALVYLERWIDGIERERQP